MPDPLNITATSDSPAVTLDVANNKFEISGPSTMSDPDDFYQPVIDWWNAYSTSSHDETNFTIKLSSLDHDSFETLIDVLDAVDKVNTEGSYVTLIWLTQEDDEDMMEQGDLLSIQVDIPFDFRTYE